MPGAKAEKPRWGDGSQKGAQGSARRGEGTWQDPGPARIPDIRIHISPNPFELAGTTGASLHMIGRTSPQEREHNGHLCPAQHRPGKESMQKATNAMFSAGGLAPKAEVVPMKSGKAAKARR